MTISDLIERIGAGDRKAFAGVIRRYQRPLFGFLGRMGLPQARAEEVAQETFLRAWAKLAQYDPARASFSTWLFTIARNQALNELDLAANRREMALGEAMPDVACERAQPPAALEAAQQKRRLQQALHQLPLHERSVLALMYVDELDVASIARIEATTPGAIKTRLHRARQRLRAILETQHG